MVIDISEIDAALFMNQGVVGPLHLVDEFPDWPDGSAHINQSSFQSVNGLLVGTSRIENQLVFNFFYVVTNIFQDKKILINDDVGQGESQIVAPHFPDSSFAFQNSLTQSIEQFGFCFMKREHIIFAQYNAHLLDGNLLINRIKKQGFKYQKNITRPFFHSGSL